MSGPKRMRVSVAEEGETFMAGLTFHWVMVDLAGEVQGRNYIEHPGGKVVTRYDADVVTHVVLATTGGGADDGDAELYARAELYAELYARATRDRKRVVSWSWVEACMRDRRLVSIDDSALFVPPPLAAGHPAMRGLRVCVTGYQARPAPRRPLSTPTSPVTEAP